MVRHLIAAPSFGRIGNCSLGGAPREPGECRTRGLSGPRDILVQAPMSHTNPTAARSGSAPKPGRAGPTAATSLSGISAPGVLVALGIIYGDIGTSPLYVLRAVIGSHLIDDVLVYGALSLVFWTLTLQTTIKYVVLTLQADNKGEGGIFSLYTLVRRRNPRLFLPALIGGSALLADGIITPPISVASAVEGLRLLSPNIETVPIVVTILVVLFSLQRFGTKSVGTLFGPIMLLWFSMLGVLGFHAILGAPEILGAISPTHAFRLLSAFPGGFWILGAVFLCTTGAEALYSDLGHCGRGNITIGWGFVKTTLILNYFGQGAWLLQHRGLSLGEENPFYALMPSWFLISGIIIATAATIIASQALITGSFTVVNEAIRLYLFPKVKVAFPTDLRGQIYIPAINVLLLLGCVGVVLFFRESSNMEAAYGLAITLAMLMTTVLMGFYLAQRRVARPLVALFFSVYLVIEISFLIANLKKFSHGGYFTILIAVGLGVVMLVWNRASQLKRRFTEYTSLTEALPVLQALSADTSVAKTATHLVYMTGAPLAEMIETKILYSLLRKGPKRADVYWFIHVDVADEPHTCQYEVKALVPQKIYRIDFTLGFRVEPRINMLFRRVIEDMAQRSEVNVESNYPSLKQYELPADFRFVVLEKHLSVDNELPPVDQLVMDTYFFLKRFSLSESDSFGLDTSSVLVEKVPLLISPLKCLTITRLDENGAVVPLPAPCGEEGLADDSESALASALKSMEPLPENEVSDELPRPERKLADSKSVS